MNNFYQALNQGYSVEDIIKYLSKSIPAMAEPIQKASKMGYTSHQILGYLSKAFSPRDIRGKSESDIHAENKINDAQMVKHGLMMAGTALAAPIASQGAYTALARALPASVQKLAPGIANAAQQSIPTGNANNAPASVSMQSMPQQGMPLQSSNSQVSPVNPVASNIAQAQPVAQPEGISNPKEYLEKLGIKDKIDELLKVGNTPEQVAAVLGMKSGPGRLKSGIDPELVQKIDEYSKIQEKKSPEIQKQEQKTKEIPEHLMPLFSETSKVNSLNELKERMYTGTQSAFGDRDIQRLGRLRTLKGNPNIIEYAEKNPDEWKEAFSRYGKPIPKLGMGKIAIYRALPKDKEIETGDYVAVTKEYAEQHLEHELGRTHLTKKIVNVEDVINDADDPNEWIYAPKNDVEFMSSLSHEDIFNLSRSQKKNYKKEKDSTISKNETVASPNGIGEVKEVRNGQAIIDVDGKLHKVKEEELEAEPEEVKNASLDFDPSTIPEELRSAPLNEVYTPGDRRHVTVKFNAGLKPIRYLYYRKDGQPIPEDFINKIKEGVQLPITSGLNFWGAWDASKSDSRGAANYQELVSNSQEEGEPDDPSKQYWVVKEEAVYEHPYMEKSGKEELRRREREFNEKNKKPKKKRT